MTFQADTGTFPAYYSPAVVVGANGGVNEPGIHSPEGGDSFAFLLPGGQLASSETGLYGTATIDSTDGIVSYSPTAPFGPVTTDTFTVSDTDALGVTTTTTASFEVDAWTLNYGTPPVAGTTAVSDAPAMLSPAGADTFDFILPAGGGLSTTEAGNYGTAFIDPTTGVITYTPLSSATPPGQWGDDQFAVTDTDALGVTNQTNVTFKVDGGPEVVVPATATVVEGIATTISGISLSENNAISGEVFTATVSDADGAALSASASTPYGADTITGSGSEYVVIAGTLNQVNYSLSNLTYTNNEVGPDTITVSADDSFHTAVTTQTIAITVNAQICTSGIRCRAIGATRPIGFTRRRTGSVRRPMRRVQTTTRR